MPAATNLGNAKKALSASVTSLGGLPTIDESLAIYLKYDKAAADGAAATNTADTTVWVNPFNFPVYVAAAYGVGVGAGIAQDPANYATVAFKTSDGAGGATATAVAADSLTGGGGTWTSNQTKAFTSPGVTLANTTIPANGGMLWFNITKSGTGVVVPVSYYIVKLYKAET